MLLDANLLVYAVVEASPFHARSRAWLEAQLSGPIRIGVPWASTLAFLRLVTNPRVINRPLSIEQAWEIVEGWLARDVVWIPQPTTRHRQVLGGLLTATHLSANHVPDAHLAALAIEHGLTLCSNDSDFARFPELSWTNPLATV